MQDINAWLFFITGSGVRDTSLFGTSTEAQTSLSKRDEHSLLQLVSPSYTWSHSATPFFLSIIREVWLLVRFERHRRIKIRCSVCHSYPQTSGRTFCFHLFLVLHKSGPIILFPLYQGCFPIFHVSLILFCSYLSSVHWENSGQSQCSSPIWASIRIMGRTY